MIWLLAILTALLVAWHERCHPGVASDPCVVGIFSALAAIAGTVATVVGEAASAVGSAVGSAAGAVGSAAGTVGTGIADAAQAVGTGVGNAAQTVGQGVESAAKTVGTGVEDAAKSVWSGAKDVGGKVGDTLHLTGNAESAPAQAGQEAGKSSDIMGKIQTLMKAKAAMGGGGGGHGGGGGEQQPGAPALSHQPGAPFQVPVAHSGIEGLMQAIAARRARLAGLSVGGGFGGGQ